MASVRPIGAFLLLALAAPASGEDGPTPVRFDSEPGREVRADWFAGGKGMPALLALGGEGPELKIWNDFAAKRPKGFGALVVASGTTAAADAEGALRWLRAKGEADPARIVIMAGPSCAIGALTVSAREKSVAGCWLAGANGIDRSVDPLVQNMKGRSLVVVCGKELFETPARKYWDELPPEPGREVSVWDGMPIADAMDVLLRGKLVDIPREWVASVAGREILDGKLDPWEAAAFMGERGVVGKKRAVLHGKDAQARLRWDGAALSFHLEACYPFSRGGLSLPNGWFDLQITGSAVPSGRIRFIGNWTSGWSGQERSVSATITRRKQGGGEVDSSVPSLEGILVVSGDFIEARVPWDLVDLKGGGDVEVSLDGSPKGPEDKMPLVQAKVSIP